MARLYIGGLQSTTTQADLQPLLSKIGHVDEIYVPEKKVGWKSGFAIARIAEGCDQEKLTKTIKALNGSVWKGTKIRIEMAKEWYVDRIAKEKSDALNMQPAQPQQSQPLKTYVPPQPSTVQILTIRKARGLSKKRVSADPVIICNDKLYNPKAIDDNKRLVCNKKIIFDDDLLDLEKYKEPVDVIKDNRKQSADQKTVPKNDKPTIPSSGKGVRRGFGALLNLPAVDCCIEDPEDEIEPEVYVPSVPAEDLLPENLEKERERALSVFLAISEAKRRKLNDTKKPTPKEDKPAAPSKPQKEIVSHTEPSPAPQPETKTVNITKLKDIFAKEGGVWWNSMENVKDVDATAFRGDANNDLIFREAEQFGFDIRDNSKQTNNLFNFNFVEQPVDTKPENQKIVSTTTSENRPHVEATAGLGKLSLFDLSVVLSTAKRFHRDSSLQDTQREWEEAKHNRISDIRKKNRDAKRLAKTKNSKRVHTKPSK